MPSLPRFEYLAPKTLEEAVTILKKEQRAKVIAGGTDLLVKMKKREATYQKLIGLKNIPNLNFIIEEENVIKLGPMVIHEEAEKSLLLNRYTDFLAEACRHLGSYQVRCMGTVAGNVCNASPSADTIPSLLILDARLRIVNPKSDRVLPIDQFIVKPFETVLQRDEILTAIEISKPLPGSKGVYLKIPKVTEKDETLVGIALLLKREFSTGIIEDIRIGLGSVAPFPIRAKKTETYLRGKNPEDRKSMREAKDLLMIEISPRSRADYRRKMTEYLFDEALRAVLNKS